MQKKRKPIDGGWLAGLGAMFIGLAPVPSIAIGFGNAAPVATLGQPLDVSVPVRLEPGEDLEPECIAAEVTIVERFFGTCR